MMHLALLDHEQQPLPTAVKNLPVEMAYRLRKRLPVLSSRATVVRAVEAVLAELEAELRDQSRRL